MSIPQRRPSAGSRVDEAARRAWFESFFRQQFPRLHRYLARYSGDPEIASELSQEAFVRLYRRRSRPDDPEAWLFTVGINLVRNAKSKESRRRQLLTLQRSTHVLSDPPAEPGTEAGADEERARVRRVLSMLKPRDRQLLLLRAEGLSYQELADALELHGPSVGTQLKRAKEAFRKAYGGLSDAP